MNRYPRTFSDILGWAAGLATALTLGGGPVFGDTQPQPNLEAVQQSLKDAREQEQELSLKAAKVETAIAELRHRSIAIAARIQEHESLLLKLEDREKELERQQKDTAASLNARHRQLAAMLAALQRISMHPPVALIALPTKPIDTVRSTLLLRSTVPPVLTLGRALRNDLEALSELARAVAAARSKMIEEDAALRLQQAALTELETQKKALAEETRQAYTEAQERAAKLGQEARDLQELVARLAAKRAENRKASASRRAPPPHVKPSRNTTEMASLSPGLLPDIPVLESDGLPVRGRIQHRFGRKRGNGGNTRGVSIKTRPGSMVIAPRDGLIVFAGPFRGLGQLLIIEYETKYHLLLAGLGRIDKQVGENVLAGEPVGIMDASQTAGPALYMELRRNGQPINPLPWLAAGRTEVNG